MKFYVVGVLVLLHFGCSSPRLVPILTACPRNDVNFERCVKAAVEQIRPYIARGYYGEGQPAAPSLEPISIDKMSIDHGPGFRAKLLNVTIRGAGNFVIRRVKLNMAEKTFNVSVMIPNMLVNGQYILDMKVLVLRISGQGNFDLNLDNTIAHMQLKYSLKPGPDGKEYVQFNPIPVKLRFDKGRFNLQNLFNGDPALGKIGNAAINEDPHVLLDEVKPAFEQSLSRIFTAMANSAVSGATELDILPL